MKIFTPDIHKIGRWQLFVTIHPMLEYGPREPWHGVVCGIIKIKKKMHEGEGVWHCSKFIGIKFLIFNIFRRYT